MGEGADGDAVRASRRHRPHVLQSNAPGYFHECLPLDQSDGLTDKRRGHVIQQNDVGSPCEGLSHVCQGLHFYNNSHTARGVGFGLATGRLDWRGRSRQEGEMIVFDENAIAQGLAMIRAAAEEHGPFLKRT